MDEENVLDNDLSQDDEPQFELSPEEATSLDNNSGLKPNLFNRKKVMIFMCCTLAVVVGGGLIFNSLRPQRNSSSSDRISSTAGSSSQFIGSLRDDAIRQNLREQQAAQAADAAQQPVVPETFEPDSILPPVSINRPSPAVESVRNPAPAQPQPQPQQAASAPQSQQQAQQRPTHYRSSLVPQMQGNLFNSPSQQNIPASSSPNSSGNSAYDDYLASLASARASVPSGGNASDQNSNQNFYDSSSFGGTSSGYFLGENALWMGTMIPGILETSINTDLPGNVRARVTQNIFDSQTGRTLLIPQGTILIARYNSSVSYAQSRVQIVWDILIRPDGFQVELDGAPGVDRQGMSGQQANYSENWFEYIKAAGIITLFSIANANLVETAARHGSETVASNVAASNAQFVNQLGGNLISRAMSIQPTLTVENGTLINIMLNKTLYLPPVPPYPATQRYVLE